VARTDSMRNVFKILVGKPEGRRPSEGRCVDRRIILKCFRRKEDENVRIGFIRLGIGNGSELL
jgi:hypothetical protein